MLKLVPDADIQGNVGRPSYFEVIADDKYLAYSKVATGVFPDFAALAQQIASYAGSGSVPNGWKLIKK